MQVIDNVLEESNSEGWNQLSDVSYTRAIYDDNNNMSVYCVQTEEGAEDLLNNVELYGSYIVEAIANPEIEVDLNNGELVLNASFDNICESHT